jgi:hypothetical protein
MLATACLLVAAARLRGAPLAGEARAAPTVFVCPMHPEVRRERPDRCPECGMALVGSQPAAEGAYHVRVTTDPAPPRAGERVTVTLAVRAPDRTPATAFELLYERRLHVYLVDEGLGHFVHLRPDQLPDGQFAAQLELPHPGRYQLFVEMAPSGGAPQVLGHPLYTEAHEAAPAAVPPPPVANGRVTSHGLALRLEPARLPQGREGRLRLTVSDARTGGAPADLERFAGAHVHLFAVADDLGELIHTHGDLDRQGRVVLPLRLPRARAYRAFVELRRRGEPLTFALTLSAQLRGADRD